MDKNSMPRKIEETLKMLKLFQEDKLTLPEIGKIYGISIMAVRRRFDRMGVVYGRRAYYSSFDKTRLIHLYETEELPPRKVGEFFGVSENVILALLKYYKIPIRRPQILKGRYMDLLKKLKIGGSVEIESNAKNPSQVLHASARTAGIKISLRNLGGNKFTAVRISKEEKRYSLRYSLIDKKLLKRFYTKYNLSLADIGKNLGYSEYIIRKALEFYKIPKRRPINKNGRYFEIFRRLKNGRLKLYKTPRCEPIKKNGRRITLLRKLEIGQTIKIHYPVKYPCANLHNIANRAGIKISMRNLEGGWVKVTRVG